MNNNIEVHPLEPFLPPNAKLLMLGSFPPKKERWGMNFYYPNFINDMWRIYGWIFFQDKGYFLADNKKSFDERKIRSFLEEKGIAITDSGKEIIRLKDNASDKFLEIVKTVDLHEILKKIPHCHVIMAAGQKATSTFLTIVPVKEPKVGNYTEFMYDGRKMKLYRMPSSSRAYPKSIEEKAEDYRKVFMELGMI
ncbi:uracil-DNA glycosylase family protein [Parabacteroides pacaensis]|uniref:uracil-DNA glycosylase family protein n=1 Tax=Parabacteroides pacaensis TaxID=2086575 RepID=UPI000D0F9EAE|nr:uracil-DNA glycosylase family protein [Parabacteroides pacaensis]